MSTDMRDLEQTDGDLLMCDVSDETLEAAGDRRQAPRSVFINTDNVMDCC